MKITYDLRFCVFVFIAFILLFNTYKVEAQANVNPINLSQSAIDILSSSEFLSEVQKTRQQNMLKILNNDPSTLLILDQRQSLNMVQNTDIYGPRTGGGGNKCSLAIQHITRRLIVMLDQTSLILSLEDRQKLIASMANVVFVARPSLTLNGETKDAINYPMEKIILVSFKFCDAISNHFSIGDISTLFHEYLRLAQIEDRVGQISGEFWEKFSATVPTAVAASESEFLARSMQIETLKIRSKVQAFILSNKLSYDEAICQVSRAETVKILSNPNYSSYSLIALTELSNECLLIRTQQLKEKL